jgi:hypothetical protein
MPLRSGRFARRLRSKSPGLLLPRRTTSIDFRGDIRNMTSETRRILTNAEAIAVDQDKLGKQGWRVARTASADVWMKPLERGAIAVALLNRDAQEQTITAEWNDLKLKGQAGFAVRDLWAHTDLGSFKGSFSAKVGAHATMLVKLAPEESQRRVRVAPLLEEEGVVDGELESHAVEPGRCDERPVGGGRDARRDCQPHVRLSVLCGGLSASAATPASASPVRHAAVVLFMSTTRLRKRIKGSGGRSAAWRPGHTRRRMPLHLARAAR